MITAINSPLKQRSPRLQPGRCGRHDLYRSHLVAGVIGGIISSQPTSTSIRSQIAGCSRLSRIEFSMKLDESWAGIVTRRDPQQAVCPGAPQAAGLTMILPRQRRICPDNLHGRRKTPYSCGEPGRAPGRTIGRGLAALSAGMTNCVVFPLPGTRKMTNDFKSSSSITPTEFSTSGHDAMGSDATNPLADKLIGRCLASGQQVCTCAGRGSGGRVGQGRRLRGHLLRQQQPSLCRAAGPRAGGGP